MNSKKETNKRIAKNTIFLYLRLIIIMGVTLYTSRIILNALGVVDYGIYNVVGSLGMMFTFFRSSLSNATQRFLNFELGRGSIESVQKIFSLNSIIYFSMSIFVIIIGEIVGLWLLYEKLNIPHERLTAAFWVFQTTLISLFFTLNGIVYNSVLIARENMKIYAYIGIFEAIYKLAIAFIIENAHYDKLILYSILYIIGTISIQILYVLYCIKNYPECKFSFYWEKSSFIEMFKFVGWNGFGTAIWAINSQGTNIILNLFFGPIVNAARGISSQVENTVNNFSSNFFTAVRPQIIKSYASKDLKYFIDLIFKSSKYSFFLMLVLCIPIEFRISYILNLWLKAPPSYAAAFIQWVLIYSMINVLTNPFWAAIQAVGRLKRYCLIGGLVFLSAFPISYITLLIWEKPIVVFQILVITRLLYLFVIVRIVNEYVKFSFSQYVKETLIPIISVSASSIIICFCFNQLFKQNFISLLILSILFTISTLTFIYFLGLQPNEKKLVVNKIKSLINGNIKQDSTNLQR